MVIRSLEVRAYDDERGHSSLFAFLSLYIVCHTLFVILDRMAHVVSAKSCLTSVVEFVVTRTEMGDDFALRRLATRWWRAA